MPASGTAAQVEKAFGVGLGEYSSAGKTLREADSRVNVPASIASVAGGVMGINQIAAQPAALEPPPGAFITAPPCSTDFGGKTKTTTYGDQNPGYPDTMPDTVCGYVGTQLRSAYDIPASDTGSGATVAIVDAYDLKTMASDATHYFNTSDPSAPFAAADYTAINQGPFDQQNVCGNWGDEQAIDVESSHSLAPDAHILYVGAQDCFDQGLFNAEQTVVDGHLANVISNSWGDDAGDLLTDAATKTAYDDLFQLADTTGIGIQFSSGDNGDNFDLVGFSSADYPAESPYVTSVGGTSLKFGASTSTINSYGWSTGKSNKCEANVAPFLQGCNKSNFGTWLPAGYDGSSGGFTSYNYSQPWYQNGIVPTALSERNAAIDGPVPMRVEPDISLDADPATGFLIGLTEAFPDGSAKYGTTRYGGTSLASPILAGIVADIDQAGGVAAGFLNPTVYHVSQTTHTAARERPGRPVPGPVPQRLREPALRAGHRTGSLGADHRRLPRRGVLRRHEQLRDPTRYPVSRARLHQPHRPRDSGPELRRGRCQGVVTVTNNSKANGPVHRGPARSAFRADRIGESGAGRPPMSKPRTSSQCGWPHESLEGRASGAARTKSLRRAIPRSCTSLQYGGRRSENIGKWRTFRVSKRDPLRMAVAAIARSALSIV